MVTMAKRPYEELIEFLQQELGDRLRVVFRVGADDSERLFARSDLASSSDGELVEPFARVFLGSDSPGYLVPRGPDRPDCLLGFEETTVDLLLYPNPNEAVVVAFDRRPGIQLETFVQRCLGTIR